MWIFCFQDTELKAVFLMTHNLFLYTFLHSQSGLSPLNSFIEALFSFCSIPALLFSF